MPHTALFGLSVFMCLVFTALSALFALIETGASEPLSRNYLSLSSAAAGGRRLWGPHRGPCTPNQANQANQASR